MNLGYEDVLIKEGPCPLLRRVKCVAKQNFKHVNSEGLKKPNILFLDYDNTLVDSWPQDFVVSNEVFEKLGHPPMSVVDMVQQPHVPAVEAISNHTGNSYETVKKIYDQVYETVHRELAPPVPGAEEFLEFLKEEGISTVLLSNKEHNLLEDTVRKIGWKGYFSHVRGAKKGSPNKPHPETVLNILKEREIKIPKDRIFLAGDAVSTDIACALSAGILPIWISQFSLDHVKFAQEGPSILHMESCKHFMEFLRGLE